MDNKEQMSSVMIRNVPVEAKRNFENICTANGITLQESIRQYISSFGKLDEMQVILQTAYALCFNRPDLVDMFIAEREPFYMTLQDGPQKVMMRQNFVVSNPSHIFQRYAEELRKKENVVDII